MNSCYPITACNCHGKADECYYDEDVARRNLSLNIHGKYIGGGVCINCTQNTAGINCETCIDGFFRPKGVKYTFYFMQCYFCFSWQRCLIRRDNFDKLQILKGDQKCFVMESDKCFENVIYNISISRKFYCGLISVNLNPQANCSEIYNINYFCPLVTS